MLLSMTGFGMAQSSSELGSVTVEVRSVNSRYLDIQFRLPDELRMAEQPLRELIASKLKRGKIDVRASFARTMADTQERLNDQVMTEAMQAYATIRRYLPDAAPPSFHDIWNWPTTSRSAMDPMLWLSLVVQAGQMALDQTVQTRAREGARLAQIMQSLAQQAHAIAQTLAQNLPALLNAQRDKASQKLREALEQIAPQGFTHISGEELSGRLATEASLFAMRVDVAEELDRLGSHLTELTHLLEGKALHQSLGKRLDFLFQEMNREANTLGSKSGHLEMTRTAMDLKLIIEQMREQAQNIE